jgi:PAS domain S-box-containing protein
MDSRLSFLLNQSNDFLCVFDRIGTVLYINLTLSKTLGYSETEMLGKKAFDYAHPADIIRIEELINGLALKNEVSGYECRIKAKDGRYFNIKWSIILNTDDNLVYATGVNASDGLNDPEQINTISNIQHIIQSFSEGFFAMDKNWQITSYNPAFQAITGLTGDQLKNINFREIDSLGINDTLIAEFESAFNASASSQLQYYNAHFNRWLRVNVYPYKNEVVAFIRDITNIKIQQLILALEKNVLELNASSTHALPQTINELITGIEAIFPDMICSVLEVDDAQEKIYHLSAPRLPKEYIEAIDGTYIGPKAGSCGTAAYHRTQIIVSDIENDPLWEDYRHLILASGIKACWSTPIISSNSSKVLATFAVYYKTKRQPKPEELRMIERTANILRVLMENKRSQEHVKDQHKRLQEIAAISSHEIRRPVATILGLVNLFDRQNADNPLNNEIINHIDFTAQELDSVIHTIVEKTVFLKGEI